MQLEKKTVQSSENEYICEEIVLGLLAPIGTDIQSVNEELTRQLEDSFGYIVEHIKLSDFIAKYYENAFAEVKKTNCKFCEKREKIIHGTKLRKEAKDCSILAKLAISEINRRRNSLLSEEKGISRIDGKGLPSHKRSTIRIAYIVDQLKRKEEIEVLNEVYKKSFFLIGAQGATDERTSLLIKQIGKPESFAQELMDLDQSEEDYYKTMGTCSSCERMSKGHSPLDSAGKDYGQQLSKIFSEADIFLADSKSQGSIRRFLDLVFASPVEFPTASEHAMFMAFSASTRSADLSRQVGAVILSKAGDLISSGSNDVPRAGGGLYDRENHMNDGAFGFEANSKRLTEISNNITQFLVQEGVINGAAKDEFSKKILKNTEIGSLTEFHRTVHAEMQAILSAARSGTSSKGGEIFVTTFPCHNCAKHIVSAGIETVYYVEPYAKSHAKTLHKDSIVLVEDQSEVKDRVVVRPYLGVGPRRFLDLFSMKLSCGQSLVRKDGYSAKEYKRSKSRMRFWSMFPFPFLEQPLKAESRNEILSIIEDLQKQIEVKKSNGACDYQDIEVQIGRLQNLQKMAA